MLIDAKGCQSRLLFWYAGTGTMSSVTLVSSSGKSFAGASEVYGKEGSSVRESLHDDQAEEEGSPATERSSLSAMIEPKLTQSQPKIVQSGLLTRLVLWFADVE